MVIMLLYGIFEYSVKKGANWSACEGRGSVSPVGMSGISADAVHLLGEERGRGGKATLGVYFYKFLERVGSLSSIYPCSTVPTFRAAV